MISEVEFRGDLAELGDDQSRGFGFLGGELAVGVEVFVEGFVGGEVGAVLGEEGGVGGGGGGFVGVLAFSHGYFFQRSGAGGKEEMKSMQKNDKS